METVAITVREYNYLKSRMSKYGIVPIAEGGIARDRQGNLKEAYFVEINDILDEDTEKIKVDMMYYKQTTDYYADMKKYNGFHAYIYRDSIIR